MANKKKRQPPGAKVKRSKVPYCEMITISPRRAENWLAGANTDNRQLRNAVVERLARDIKNGDWTPNHQGLAFDCNGVLLDGQHRLAAVVLAGQAILAPVWFNAIRAGIDVGVTRNTADILTLEGELGKVTRHDLATLRALLRGVPGRQIKRTVSEERKLLKMHRTAIDYAHAHMGESNRIPGIATGTTRGVIARAWYSADLDELAYFAAVLREGIMRHQADQPIGVLWRYLLKTKHVGGSVPTTERYGKTERALYAYLKGEKLEHLYAATKELFPLPDETPEGTAP